MNLRRSWLVVVLLCISASNRVRADVPGLDGLDTFVEGVLAEWKVPGMAVAVVKEGEVILMKGYGFRDREAKLPVTAKTLFAIGSISKSFAATGLGMLVDQGKLTWDTPVRDLLPEFRLKDKVAESSATARDLLSHRTGLPRHDLLWYDSSLSRREVLERLRFLEPNGEFRSIWQYNNMMFLAAGMLDERISGKSWEELTRERIFRPLGMTSSNFSVLESQKSDDFARPYSKVGDEVRLVPFYQNIEAIAPAGAINSNVEEMIRYVRFHLDGGRYGVTRLLSTRSAERLRSPETVISDAETGALHNPTTFPELGRVSYGLGFFLTTYRGHDVAWHSGSINGFSALMTLLPREKVGVIVLTNLSGNRPAPVCVTRRILDRLVKLEPIDWVARAKEIDAKAAQADRENRQRDASESSGSSPSHAWNEYAGTFEHPAYGSVTVSALGEGLTFAWRNLKTSLVHRRYDVFETANSIEDESPSPKFRVSFAYGSDGAIDRLAMPLEPSVADVVFARKASFLQRLANAPYDLIILNGKIVDGTGNAWFLGDLAVKGDVIARIAPAGQLRGVAATKKIDASGLVVAPGFIDIQGHSREELLEGDGRLVGKVTQGVTTEILGEGESDAPSKRFDGPHGFDAWLKAMKKHGGSVNFGSFVGSQTVRAYVKGMKRGEPTAPELETMKRLVRDAMKDGAFGLASALIYPPDSFVSTEDLIALSREMSPFGGVYITHIRSEADQLLEAIDEAIRIGKEGGVPVEIYHLKAAGRRNWDKARLAVEKIADARAKGLDVGANMYPYTAAGTGLTACLPPSASADGKLLENLADPKTRAAIREEVLHPTTPFENLGELATPEGILVLGLEKSAMKKYAGKRLSEIAEAEGKPWVDTAIDLILAERKRVDTIYFLMNEDNLKLQLRQPWIKFGTDASGHDPEKPDKLVHPRSYGTFARILGKYVRDEGVLTLEDAIRKMTSAVAARLSIRDRGLLREGFRADVVVFDPSTIADKATFEAPHQTSVGVRDVFVNGVAVILEGKHTGALPGQIVRGPGHRATLGTAIPARSGGTAIEPSELGLRP
jgi:N-acyl-D-amino-acid deacylase